MNFKNLLDLKSFDLDTYKNIPMDNLVLYAVWKVQDLDFEKNFYNICVASFRLFPNKFSLLGFPQYPDSKRIHDCLWHCFYKSKGWLIGKTKHGYDFSTIGLKMLEKTRKWLEDPENRYLEKTQSKRGKTRDGRREALIINELIKSRAFQRYEVGDIEKIDKADICFALQGTLDTPKDILEKNLKLLKDIINRLERKDLNEFISTLEKKSINL